MIKVQSDKLVPAAYATIYINGKPFAAADSVGIDRIPLARLYTGDTIAVSYIGASTEMITFDETIRNNGSHTFTLKEKYLTLEPVTVTGQKYAEEFFNRYTRFFRTTPALYYKLAIAGDVRYSIAHNSPAVIGTFVNKNSVGDKNVTDNSYSRLQYFNYPAQIMIASDTAGISESLLRDINYALSRANEWLDIIQFKKARERLKVSYGYLGISESENCRVFRLSLISSDGYPVQVLLYADAGTKNIRKMKIRTLSAPDRRVTESVEIIAECETAKGYAV